MNKKELATVVATGILVVISIIAVIFLMPRNAFLAVIVLILYVVAIWRGVYLHLGDHKSAAVITTGVALVIYLVAIVLTQYKFAGSNPLSLLLILGVVFLLYAVFNLLEEVLGGGSFSGKQKIVVVVILALIGILLVFFTVFGGKWANIGGLVGEAGYNAISEPISAVSGVVGGVPQSVKNQFDPCHNKRMAEIQCAADLYLGGNVYSAATGSASVSQCVKDKIAECDAAAKSEKVTDPVVVELGNTIIEPFNIDTDDSHLRVFIPLTNTMVNDLQGRPLDVPAEDVNVSVGFQYLDKEVASAWDNVSYIPNSETRYVEFEENDEGNFLFPAVNAESTMTDQEIREKLQEVKKNCAGDELDSDFDIEPEDGDDVDNGSEAAYSSECVNAVGTIEKDLESEGGNLQPERLAMIAETLDTPVADAMPDSLAVHFSDSLGDNRVRVKRNHDVNVDVSYNYSVEAAFTDSSRWSSGNNLLKVWTEPSWGELDPGERESWRKENCGTVKKQGIDFQKQRTSALTTPVVPVMYADCGGSLFTGFDELARQGDQYRKDITISAGANLNPDLSDRAESFRIFEAQTDCTGEGTKHLTDLEGTYDVEGGEAQIQPEDFEREVTVEGDKKTIGCSMNMSIRVNLENTVKYAEGSNED